MITFSAADQEKLKTVLQTAENNLHALELFSSYLHFCPRFVKEEDVNGLTECGVDVETAQRLLVAAACGLDAEARPDDQVMEEQYFRYAIHLLDAQECRKDPYYQAIKLPEISRGKWKMGYKTIEAYELFTSDDLKVLPDGREIPQTGFFTENFTAPVVEENGREWMTVTPSEINTMTSVVVERDPEVISLFHEFILPQFPHKDKLTVVEADAYAFAEKMGDQHFDCAYVDIWHDVLDGVEMYLKMKRLEVCSPGTNFLYWIEPSMLAWLRGMALMEVAEKINGPMLESIGDVDSIDRLIHMLNDENLKKLAPIIPLEVARR